MSAAVPGRSCSARSSGVVLVASARAVDGAGLRLPVAAALVLVAVTSTVTDSYGVQVLGAVGVLLAFTLQAAVDDPERSILAAAPYSLGSRSLHRVVASATLAVPVWLVAAGTVEWRTPSAPVAALGLQAVVIWCLAVAIGAGVWRASASPSPSYVASPVLLGLVLVAHVLPRRWQIFDAQAWGPPWIAAQLRWCGLLLLAIGLVILLLTEPMVALTKRPQASSAP